MQIVLAKCFSDSGCEILPAGFNVLLCSRSCEAPAEEEWKEGIYSQELPAVLDVFDFRYVWNLIRMCWNCMCRKAKLINTEQLVLFFEKRKNKCTTCKIQSGFHHTKRCVSHRFQDFNASSLPPGSLCRTRWRFTWRAGNFLLLLFFFPCSVQRWGQTMRGRNSTCTISCLKCVMRHFFKWCVGRVQSSQRSKKIWFNFQSVESKCDQAGVFLVNTLVFKMIKKASYEDTCSGRNHMASADKYYC